MNDELKKADEIVRALRCCLDLKECRCEGCVLYGQPCDGTFEGLTTAAADLIDSLTAQLADYHHMSKLVDGKMAENQRLRKINEKLQSKLVESQRREKAAGEDICRIFSAGVNCIICKKVDGCPLKDCTIGFCKSFGYCGPLEAEKGEAE